MRGGEANDDNVEAAAQHKASRTRVERTTRTTTRTTMLRPVRRLHRESSTVRGTGEATPVQASPGADDVIPNPYHTR